MPENVMLVEPIRPRTLSIGLPAPSTKPGAQAHGAGEAAGNAAAAAAGLQPSDTQAVRLLSHPLDDLSTSKGEGSGPMELALPCLPPLGQQAAASRV
jgi:hypothetical protein